MTFIASSAYHFNCILLEPTKRGRTVVANVQNGVTVATKEISQDAIYMILPLSLVPIKIYLYLIFLVVSVANSHCSKLKVA